MPSHGGGMEVTMKTASLLSPDFGGAVGKLTNNITDNWLIGLRESNPAILDMFHDRDKQPYRDMLPWSGEFAGKYITGAYYIYQINRRKDLREYILTFIDELLTCIDSDGYAGCFRKECRMTGAFSQSPEKTGETWDAWSHYHIMFGLFLWYRETKDKKLLETVEKIAGFFLNHFYNGKKRLAEIGSTEMNLVPIHIFALLYQETGKQEYLNFAKEIEQDISLPEAGNYINHALNGTEFYQCPKPRWESLHIIMGIAEMYNATGDEKYRKVSKQIFRSILKTDIHNTGAFSTDEQAVGTPFKKGNVELCCVIAYNALACEILKLTGDPAIADFLELSFYNAVMGSYSPSGRWSTYNTPMEGEKNANHHSIWFQCRPGSPELNCCSANSARGIGMLSEWAITEEDDTVYLNYFGRFSTETASGISICIDGDYPAANSVTIAMESNTKKKIAIRIPSWSKNTEIRIEDKTFLPPAGEYFILKEIPEKEIQITFDFSLRILQGEEDFAGKTSLYYGPVLYGYDLSGNNQTAPDQLPPLSLETLKNLKPERTTEGKIVLSAAKEVTLCDFYRLGSTGSTYTTWLTCKEE